MSEHLSDPSLGTALVKGSTRRDLLRNHYIMLFLFGCFLIFSLFLLPSERVSLGPWPSSSASGAVGG